MAAIAVSTYTYLWRTDIKAALADVARAGFSDVELLAAPPASTPGSVPWAVADRIAKAAGCAGVQVNSVVPSGVDVNLASPDSSMRRWSVRYFGTIGRLAADIGARWLIIHPGRRHPLRPAPYDQYRQWVLDRCGSSSMICPEWTSACCSRTPLPGSSTQEPNALGLWGRSDRTGLVSAMT